MTLMTGQDRPTHRLPAPTQPAERWSLRVVVTLTVIVLFITWLLVFGIASY